LCPSAGDIHEETALLAPLAATFVLQSVRLHIGKRCGARQRGIGGISVIPGGTAANQLTFNGV
jgi:hypothetical protein